MITFVIMLKKLFFLKKRIHRCANLGSFEERVKDKSFPRRHTRTVTGSAVQCGNSQTNGAGKMVEK